MSLGKKILAFGLGVPVGAYIAIYLAIVADDQKGFGRIARIIETPLFLLYQWVAGPSFQIGYYFLLHLCFWSVLVGLMTLGIGVLFSKVSACN